MHSEKSASSILDNAASTFCRAAARPVPSGPSPAVHTMPYKVSSSARRSIAGSSCISRVVRGLFCWYSSKTQRRSQCPVHRRKARRVSLQALRSEGCPPPRPPQTRQPSELQTFRFRCGNPKLFFNTIVFVHEHFSDRTAKTLPAASA